MSASSRADRDYVVCDASELPPGARKIVPVGKFGVGVYNLDGELFALTNYCPHEGAPLCLGRIQGTNVADAEDPHRTVRVLEGRVLRCPWHGWEFDITTGRALADSRKGIRCYGVRVESGKVILSR